MSSSPRFQKRLRALRVGVDVAMSGRSNAPLINAFALSQLLLRKLLLEVLGALGAVWGCSEAWHVRDGSNNDQWRVLSAVVGSLFLARWFHRYVLGRKCDPGGPEVLATFLLQVLGGTGQYS